VGVRRLVSRVRGFMGPSLRLVVAGGIGALALAGGAAAGGGTTIKSAPTIVFGAQTFGNTASAPAAQYGPWIAEWWMVPLIAGDQLTLKFENSSATSGTFRADMWDKSIDDFNVSNAHQTIESDMPQNGHAELVWNAPSTGLYPLEFAACDSANPCGGIHPGAYDFTATVQHSARLAVAPGSIARTGWFLVHARYPDGTDIPRALGATLYGTWAGKWHRLGSAAVVNGVIRIHYSLPLVLKGKLLRLRIAAGGPSFKGIAVGERVAVR
jgi:hypothetical protein